MGIFRMTKTPLEFSGPTVAPLKVFSEVAVSVVPVAMTIICFVVAGAFVRLRW